MKPGELTIVLTIKNRSSFTYRWMNYMNDQYCPCHILIADGGDDKVLEDWLTKKERFANLSYEYIRYPFDAGMDQYLSKLESIISKVKTEYVILADNDDFYLLDRVKEYLAFLDMNADYIGIRGQIVNFNIFNEKGNSQAMVRGVKYEAVMNNVPSVEQASPVERVGFLCNHMRDYDYYANWYCILRTGFLQDTWKRFMKTDVKEIIVLEILILSTMAYRGKIKIDLKPFYIRQSNTSMHGDTLIVGNEFLERCIVNNSFRGFNEYLDAWPVEREGRDAILRAIAGWLEVFVVNIYNKRHAGARRKWTHRFRSNLVIRSTAKRVALLAGQLRGNKTKQRIISLPIVEPYILGEPEICN